MSKTICPYCNSKNSLRIVYSFRGQNKRNCKINYDNLIMDGTIFRNKGTISKKYDFDGERITNKLCNRYCSHCHKEFHSAGKLSIVDISIINLIVHDGTNKKRLIIYFDEKTKYDLKLNFLTIKTGFLSLTDKNNILKSIKNNKVNLWKSHYGDKYSLESNYWIFKIEYYNGTTYFVSGNDDYPNNWDGFIKPFNKFLNTLE